VTRKALSELLNGHAGASPEMAIRLEQAFGSTAETWLMMQLKYDLWQAKQRAGNLKVMRFASPAPC
jgi:addiction module HigA family antidote